MMRVLLLGLLLLSAGAATAESQSHDQHREQDPTLVRTLHVDIRPGARLSTLALVFPEGARTDPAGQPGATFLLGRILEAQGTAALLPLGGSLSIQVEPGETRVTMAVPHMQWPTAWARLQTLLRSDPLSDAILTRERQRRIDELLFQQGAPVHTFMAQWNRYAQAWALPPEQDPARPVGGTMDGLREVSIPALEARRREVFQLDAAQALLIAPPSAPALTGLEEPTRDPNPALRTPAERWQPAREVIDRALTSAWIGVAWLIPDEAHWVTADFLAHRLGELLNPPLPEPGIYRTEVSLTRAGPATLLTVVATVDPGVTYRRERQILQAMTQLASEPLQGLGLDLAQRRWKSAVSLKRMDPREEALWMAEHWSQDYGGLLPTPEALAVLLSGDLLRELAAFLAGPRILLYGPVPMMEAGPGSRGPG